MSDRPELEDLDFTPQQWAWLRRMAAIFDELSAEVPASDGPYSAPDFVEWLLLDRKGRGYHRREEQRENREAGQQRRRGLGSLASAG